MATLREKYKAFKAWQQQPHQVAPMSDEEHTCTTCGTHFAGNYCPRCGQSARIGRYSAIKAFLLFLDVWGLGNRSMFRTIRDLLFRPGYMIRDYLQGMQMAYFPPFKMFFLLVTLSIVVNSGMNIMGRNYFQEAEQTMDEINQMQFNLINDLTDTAPADSTNANLESFKTGFEESQSAYNSSQINKEVFRLFTSHANIFNLLVLIIVSGPLYLLFYRCPAYPDLRYPELFVALVYSFNMMTIVSIVANFFCINNLMFDYATLLLPLIPLKQLSGYSYWRTLANAVLAVVSIMVYVIMFSAIVSFISLSLSGTSTSL